MRKRGMPVTTIAISAGHHKDAPGAIYVEGSPRKIAFTEHEEALLWQDMLGRALYSVDSFLVPPTKLGEKVEAVNRENCKLAVEVHFNSAVNNHGKHIGSGSMTLYCPSAFSGNDRGKKLAEAIQGFLGQVFPPNRGAREGWYKLDVPGVQEWVGDVEGDEVPDYLLKATACPAVIVEPEYVHHYRDIQSKRLAGVEAIANGVKEYLTRFA